MYIKELDAIIEIKNHSFRLKKSRIEAGFFLSLK